MACKQVRELKAKLAAERERLGRVPSIALVSFQSSIWLGRVPSIALVSFPSTIWLGRVPSIALVSFQSSI